MGYTDPRITRVAELAAGGRVAILSGAGLSTESGIPDYRGRSGAALRRHEPMTHQMFVGDPVARRRYWARSHLGWAMMASARPNAGHRAVAALEQQGLIRGIITQNVDGLHTAAGSRRVIDLHGRLDRVVCLRCRETSSRSRLANRLAHANRSWQPSANRVNPDGDVEVDEAAMTDFCVVDCEACGGTLMPDVVYFGGTVPKDRVAAAFAVVADAAMLLVLGSSLTVYSGRRFVVEASRSELPVVIINEGATRGDALAAVKLEAPLGPTLSELARTLDGSGRHPVPAGDEIAVAPPVGGTGVG